VHGKKSHGPVLTGPQGAGDQAQACYRQGKKARDLILERRRRGRSKRKSKSICWAHMAGAVVYVCVCVYGVMCRCEGEEGTRKIKRGETQDQAMPWVSSQANIHVAPTDPTHPYHVHLFARDKQQVQDNGMVPWHAIALWYRMLVAWVASFYNKACCLVSAPKTAQQMGSFLPRVMPWVI